MARPDLRRAGPAGRSRGSAPQRRATGAVLNRSAVDRWPRKPPPACRADKRFRTVMADAVHRASRDARCSRDFIPYQFLRYLLAENGYSPNGPKATLTTLKVPAICAGAFPVAADTLPVKVLTVTPVDTLLCRKWMRPVSGQ